VTSQDGDEPTKVEDELPPPTRPPAFLVVLQGGTAGDVATLEPHRTLIIGRAEEADLRVPDRGVSSVHAAVTVDASGDVTIQDLGSTNGTRVNDRLLTAARPLDEGDKVAVGAVTLLKFTFDAELKEKLAEEARRARGVDILTGAYQKAFFGERLEQDFDHALRHGTPLALALFSVDGYHQLAERHGRARADAILAEVGRRSSRVLNNAYYFARLGQRRFAILFPSLTVAEACGVVEEIRRFIAATRILAGGRSIGVTISAGVAGLPFKTMESAEHLWRMAEVGLSEAQQTHDCVVPANATRND
jgi:two-component system, cell cycle response regulator